MGRLLSDVLKDYSRGFVSLENYKMANDPDYTLAFQRAIDDMPDSVAWTSGGGTIMLDGKAYNISGTIYCDKSIRIIGVGSDQGTLISLSAQSNCNMFEFGKRNSSDPISLHLEGIKFYMNPDQTGDWSEIVCYNYIRHSHFKDLFMAGECAYNFRMLVDDGGAPGRNNYFYGCAFETVKIKNVDIVHDYNLNFNSCYFGFGMTGYNTYGLYVSMSANQFVLSNCWFLQNNRSGSFYITGCTRVQIIGNIFSPEGTDCVSGSAQITLGNGMRDVNIANNIFGTTKHPYVIRTLDSDATPTITTHDNIINGSLTSPFNFANKDSVICRNNSVVGKLQENVGVATILDGDAYIEVAHSLFLTPTSVIATPGNEEAVWVDNIGSTVFRINRAGTSGNLQCYWAANIKTY